MHQNLIPWYVIKYILNDIHNYKIKIIRKIVTDNNLYIKREVRFIVTILKKWILIR